MSVVARELDEPGLQDSLLALRARFGTRTIVRGTAPLLMRSCLASSCRSGCTFWPRMTMPRSCGLISASFSSVRIAPVMSLAPA